MNRITVMKKLAGGAAGAVGTAASPFRTVPPLFLLLRLLFLPIFQTILGVGCF